MKKIISFILVFSFTLGSLAGIKTSASTSDEFIDVDIYKAQCLAGIAKDTTGEYAQSCNEMYNEYISNSLFSPTQSFLDDIHNDKTLMAELNTWEAMSLAIKPSSALNLLTKKENYYESCIIAMYSKSTINNSGFQTFLKNKIVKTSNKLVSDFCKLQQIENVAEIIEYADIKDQTTIDNIQTIVKNTYSLKTVGNISSTLSTIISYSTDILDVIDKISLYGEMVNLDYATKQWLDQMYNSCNGNTALKTALYNLTTASTDFSGTSLVYMRTGAVTLSKWTLSLFIDGATQKIASLNPIVAAVFTGLNLGKTVSNILFNSDDVYEQIYVMSCIQDLRDLSQTVTETQKNIFMNNQNKENATAFIYSLDCYFELISNVDMDCMEQLYTKLYNKGLIGKLFHNQDYQESTAILNNYKQVRKKAYNLMIDLYEVALSINYPSTYTLYYGTDIPQIKYYEQISFATNKYTLFANFILSNPITAYASNGTKLSVTYMSSNKKIATVDSTGTIKAVAPGTVTITASTPNGTLDSCTITVLPFKADKTNNQYTITSYVGRGGNVTIPSIVNSLPVVAIGKEAFFACDNITSIVIPNSVTSIDKWAFEHCTSLTSITIPNSVTNIGAYAFEDCSSLTSITIPDSVTNIGAWAFLDCTKLTSITISDSVTSIDKGAFSSCTSLTSITIPDSVTSIGDFPFRNCSKLTSINVDANNTSYSASNGILFNKNKTEIIRYPEGKTATSYIIPDSVTSIGEAAFEDCTSLTNITIPDGVTSISDDAFLECDNLASITIPDSVTSIGYRAFGRCTSLTGITIPDSVTSIGNSVFSSCSKLTNITIPDSVTSIGAATFLYCTSLTSITISDSVTSIGSLAFHSCTSLADIYYLGNKQNWANINISEESNEYLFNANIHYYSPGDIDFDGNKNLKDLVKLAQHLANWDVDMIYPEANDLNGDDKIDLTDLTHYARYLAGWDVQLTEY